MLEIQHCVIPAAPHWCVPWSLTLSVATEIGDTTTASPLVAATPAAVTIRTNASFVPPSDGDSLLAVAATKLSVVMCNRCVFGDNGVLGRRSVGTPRWQPHTPHSNRPEGLAKDKVKAESELKFG